MSDDRPSRTWTFGAACFVCLLALGLLQLGMVSVLNHAMDKAVFSVVTMILATFPLYLGVVDCGLQSELVRRFSKDGGLGTTMPAALRLRLAYGVLAYVAVLIHAWVGKLGPGATAGMAVLGLALIPASALMTSEAVGYSRLRLSRALALRLPRLIALIGFLVLCLTWFRRIDPGSIGSMAVLFGVFPAAMLFAFLLGRRSVKTGPAPLCTGSLFRQTAPLSLSVGLWWAVQSLFLMMTLRIHGETGLAEFNVALILCVPLSLLIQVINNTIASRFFSKGNRRIFRVTAIGTLGIWAATAIYGGLVTHEALTSRLFPGMDPVRFVRFAWPLFFATSTMLWVSLINLECQERGRRRLPLIGPVSAGLCLVAGILNVPASWCALPLLAGTVLGAAAMTTALAWPVRATGTPA